MARRTTTGREAHRASTLFARARVVAEETDAGLRELDPSTEEIVGLEFWEASHQLPADFLRMLPPPQVEIAA